MKHQVGNGSGLYYYEEIRKFMENKYGQKSLYADGVNIYSTIDRKSRHLPKTWKGVTSNASASESSSARSGS